MKRLCFKYTNSSGQTALLCCNPKFQSKVILYTTLLRVVLEKDLLNKKIETQSNILLQNGILSRAFSKVLYILYSFYFLFSLMC